MSIAPMTQAAPGLPYDRRLTDLRISPAVGEFAIQECARLRDDLATEIAARHTDALRSEEQRGQIDRLREANKELLAELKKTVWIARPEFPGDPYCVLCGAGKKWADKHGHQKLCAISKAQP